MPNGINIGDRVSTKYGEGEVVEIIGNNARVRINNTIVRQALTDIKQIARYTKIARTIKTDIIDNIDKNKIINIRTLESLRFGLVPIEKIEDLTIGYEEIKKWINKLLPHNNNNKSKVGTVFGNYGTGKSHILSIIRHIAKQLNYVTANIEIDGKRVRLSDPETLLSAVWTQLEANDLCSSTPLLEIYLKAIRRGMPAPTIAFNGIDRVKHNYEVIKYVLNQNCLDELEEALNAIVSSYTEYTATEVTNLVRSKTYDSSQYVRRMIGREVESRPHDFIESLFGHSEICKLAGYKGLVITIDEFEIQTFDGYIERGRDLLEVLRQYLAGNTRYKPFPCTLIFGQISDRENYDEYIDNVIKVCKGMRKNIEEINERDCFSLAEKIFNIYKSVYLEDSKIFDKNLAEESFRKVRNISGRVRAFVKDYLANLDNEFFR